MTALFYIWSAHMELNLHALVISCLLSSPDLLVWTWPHRQTDTHRRPADPRFLSDSDTPLESGLDLSPLRPLHGPLVRLIVHFTLEPDHQGPWLEGWQLPKQVLCYIKHNLCHSNTNRLGCSWISPQCLHVRLKCIIIIIKKRPNS